MLLSYFTEAILSQQPKSDVPNFRNSMQMLEASAIVTSYVNLEFPWIFSLCCSLEYHRLQEQDAIINTYSHQKRRDVV